MSAVFAPTIVRTGALTVNLASRVGEWCTDTEIRHAVWGEDGYATSTQIIATFRSNLRRKLGAAASLIEVTLSGPVRRGSRMRLAFVDPVDE